MSGEAQRARPRSSCGAKGLSLCRRFIKLDKSYDDPLPFHTGEVCFHPLPSSFLTIVLPLVHALMITHADLGAAKAQGLCVDNGGLSRLNTRSWT